MAKDKQTDHTNPADQTRLIPITDWNKFHSWPPVGGMRHLRFNGETNGFGSAFLKVGSRVLVDEAEFFRCVKRQQGQKAA
jgi:hypothetical protein